MQEIVLFLKACVKKVELSGKMLNKLNMFCRSDILNWISISSLEFKFFIEKMIEVSFVESCKVVKIVRVSIDASVEHLIILWMSMSFYS